MALLVRGMRRQIRRRLVATGLLAPGETVIDFSWCEFRTLTDEHKSPADATLTNRRILVETPLSTVAIDLDWCVRVDGIGTEIIVVTDAFAEEYALYGTKVTLRQSFVDAVRANFSAPGSLSVRRSTASWGTNAAVFAAVSRSDASPAIRWRIPASSAVESLSDSMMVEQAYDEFAAVVGASPRFGTRGPWPLTWDPPLPDRPDGPW
jgi:hypothetical protein